MNEPRGAGSGRFPPIPAEHPLAQAARVTNAYADEHPGDLGATLKWLGIDLSVEQLGFLAEQRALIGVAGATLNTDVTAQPWLAEPAFKAILKTPLWRDMAPLLLALVLDGVAIGWKGRELHDRGTAA